MLLRGPWWKCFTEYSTFCHIYKIPGHKILLPQKEVSTHPTFFFFLSLKNPKTIHFPSPTSWLSVVISSMADRSQPPPPMERTAFDTADDQTSALSTAEFLTRYEVLKRRLQRVKRLKKLYKTHYWALMEELRSSYRKYYWEYGKSPYKEDDNNNNNNNKINENSNNNNNEEKKDIEEGGFVKKCGMAGCKTKAMPMTRFCHLHILSDSKQKLYKGCSYVTKRYLIYSI